MANLKLNNVTKRFGKNVIAVNDLSLEVHDGEFLVLLGPSGCGKTTAMRMVAGLEEVTEGVITIDDVDITELPPRKRNISMIFQNYAVWPHMSVYDNIAYALKLKKMDKANIDEIVKDVAKMTKIGDYLERFPSQLSGGQQQRVAVARAIAVKPKVFLMDEPLSNLDAKLRGSMRTELKAIHTKTDATTVFVTHDQSEAMSMADRIVVMKDGEIMQVGTPEDVYDRSANIFVADFIGTPPTNFMDAELTVANGRSHLSNAHFNFELTGNVATRLQKHSKKHLVIGIRPENLELVGADNAVFSADCLVAEPQGSHQIVAVELDDKLMKIVASSRPKIKSGELIHLAFKQNAIHFFDKESGQRI
ncbi:MAG: ABC transporter ATP-binding protein [Chloroflexi bacterium]|nr:ABC transporter ATP-binding protein [Chloroflexota bacterium]